MEQYFEKLGYKKAAMIFGGIGILIIIFVFVPLLFGVQPKSQSSRSGNSIAVPTSALAPSGSNNNDMKIYSSSRLQIQYPKDWNVTNKDNEVIIHPPDTSQKDTGVTIDQIPNTPQRLSLFEASLAASHLARSTVSMNGKAITKYSGMIRSKPDGEEFVPAHIQTATFIIPDKEILYIVTYAYNSSVVIPAQETNFRNIIQSFLVKK